MKKIMKSIIICMLLALTLSVSGKGNLLQALAAGDSMSSATGISIGINYSGSITESNSKDFYRFEINSSGRVKLSAMAGMRRVYYRIYNSEGNQLWSIDPSWDMSTQLSSINEYIDLTKGIYYFVVDEFYYWGGDGCTGNYSFKLNFESAKESFVETGNGCDNTLFTANNILVNKQYHGQIACNDWKDFYKFTMPSSGRITITAAIGIIYTNGYIYDSTGKLLYETFSTWNSTTELANIEQSIDLLKGTYYFALERYEGYYKEDIYTGNYSFKLKFESANESFTETESRHNNTMSTANNIVLNKLYYGQLAENDEKDFYKFKLGSTTKIYVSVNIPGFTNYCIYNKAGSSIKYATQKIINSDKGRYKTLETYNLKAGTYYIAFDKKYGSTGPYTFKLQTSSGDTVKKTPTIRISKKTAAYRATRVRWASQSFKIGAKVSGNGKITYKKLSGSSKLVVASNGKVTVRKGTRRGTYRAIVQIRAAQSSKYKARTVKITVTVRVK